MANEDITMASGAKVHITGAPFVDAHRLLKTLIDCGKGLPVTSDVLKMDITVLKDVLFNAITSDAVEAALYKCFERVTYEGIKVTPAVMDDPKIADRIKSDYYMLAWEVTRSNCAAFFGQAFSMLKERFGTVPAIPKSS